MLEQRPRIMASAMSVTSSSSKHRSRVAGDLSVAALRIGSAAAIDRLMRSTMNS
jgi:hypothetical protein